MKQTIKIQQEMLNIVQYTMQIIIDRPQFKLQNTYTSVVIWKVNDLGIKMLTIL